MDQWRLFFLHHHAPETPHQANKVILWPNLSVQKIRSFVGSDWWQVHYWKSLQGSSQVSQLSILSNLDPLVISDDISNKCNEVHCKCDPFVVISYLFISIHKLAAIQQGAFQVIECMTQLDPLVFQVTKETVQRGIGNTIPFKGHQVNCQQFLFMLLKVGTSWSHNDGNEVGNI